MDKDQQFNHPHWTPDVTTQLQSDVRSIAKDVNEIKEGLRKDYVSMDRFKPVERVVYGMVGLMLLIVLGQIVRAVLNK